MDLLVMKMQLLLTSPNFSSFDVLPAALPSYTQTNDSFSCFRNCDGIASGFLEGNFYSKTATVFLYMFLIQAKGGPGDGQFPLTIRPGSISLTKNS
jgi:hypothetical protein